GRERHAHTGKTARRDHHIRIGERGARMQRAAAAIDLVVEEVQIAGPGPRALAVHADLNRVGAGRPRRGRMLIGRVVGLAEVEVEIDRIERHDGREFGRGGGPGPPLIRLPIETCRRLTRPLKGATMWINSILSCAAWMAASAALTAAAAARWLCVLSSRCSS